MVCNGKYLEAKSEKCFIPTPLAHNLNSLSGMRKPVKSVVVIGQVLYVLPTILTGTEKNLTRNVTIAPRNCRQNSIGQSSVCH